MALGDEVCHDVGMRADVGVLSTYEFQSCRADCRTHYFGCFGKCYWNVPDMRRVVRNHTSKRHNDITLNVSSM